MELHAADLVVVVPDGLGLEVIEALGTAGLQLDPYADRTLPADVVDGAHADVLAALQSRREALRGEVAAELGRADVPPWAEPMVAARAADDRLLGVLDPLAALLARAREIGGEVTVLGR